jgi:ADP-ribose pyrophosphatase YjhB (NUDIX family)
MIDIVNELRHGPYTDMEDLCERSADEITRLTARVAELEGVLVDIRDDEECSFSIACIVTKALGDGPKARAALSQPAQEDSR